MLGTVHPGVLMADDFSLTKPREDLVHELVAVIRPEAFDVATDVGQKSLRHRGNVDRALAPEEVKPSHARHMMLEQGEVQHPPGRCDVPGAGKINENTLQGTFRPRGSRRGN